MFKIFGVQHSSAMEVNADIGAPAIDRDLEDGEFSSTTAFFEPRANIITNFQV